MTGYGTGIADRTMPETPTDRWPIVVSALILTIAVLSPASAGPNDSMPASADDYLSPELRGRVEQLKLDVAREATTAETLQARTTVLWEWANAYSLTGGVIPKYLPLLVYVIRSRGDSQVRGTTLSTSRYLDGLVRELAIKEGRPAALGRLELEPDAPVAARSWVTLVQTWTVGEMPMVEGGGLYLSKDGFANHGIPQADDPAGDNYLSIRSSKQGARFVSLGSGNIRMPLATDLITFELEGATLEPGDTVTITYGDTSGGSRGFLVQGYSVSQFMLPVFLDLEGTGHYMQPPWPALEVVGQKETVAVKAFAPSIVGAGEAFDITVRSEDAFYNRPSGEIPGYDVLLDGAHHARILTGGDAVTLVEDIRIEEPGVHRFDIRSTDGAITSTSNPIWVRDDPPYRILWGDTHAHVASADGQGRDEGFFRFARDDAVLDFVVLSEHDMGLDDMEWSRLQSFAEEYGAEGRLIPIMGSEWTVGLPGGHHNIFYRNIRSRRVGSQDTPVLRELYTELRRRFRIEDVLTIPHAHAPGNWQISDPDIERLVEITSTHGTFEWFGNRYLEQGWEVGFIGASDNHTEHPGYTGTNTTFHTQLGGLAAVMTAEKSSDAIFTAMRDLAAYATGGERIILDATLNGAPMGRRLPASHERRFQCRVMGTAPIDTIDVIKNGDVVYSKRYISGGVVSDPLVRVGFESTSEVPTYRPPRYQRRWEGSIEVAGARLVALTPAGLENRYVEWARRDPDGAGRIGFLVETRGRLDGLILELAEADAETTVRVQVEPREQTRRQPEQPKLDHVFRLGDARAGSTRVEQVLTDDRISAGFTDVVSIQLFDPAAGLDQGFSYTDLSDPGQGDYYYLRVTQIDGELAWSSPWWVGGERPVAQPLSADEGGRQ
jgi:hypothetical protein